MHIVRRLGLLISGFVVMMFSWRWASRRYRLPCPTWLAWILEGPMVDALLGTQTTLDRMNLQPGQHVLEIGPGPGRLLVPAAQRVLPGGDVTGLDIQSGMIERLRSHAANAGVTNLTTILGDATQTPLPLAYYDAIYMCTVLGEIPEREKVLRRCYDALKPNGLLSITEMFPDPHYQSFTEVRNMAEGAGLSFRATYGPWYFYTANFVRPDGGS